MGFVAKKRKPNKSNKTINNVGAGITMFILGTIALFWSEGNFVRTVGAINEARSALVKVDDVSSLNADLEGKLIHGAAKAFTDDVFSDDLFGVSVNAIYLYRSVQYYQMTERRSETGSGGRRSVNYYYEEKWADNPVNSSDFHKEQYSSTNFVITNIDELYQESENVKWGAYQLPEFLIETIVDKTTATIRLSEQNRAALESRSPNASVHVSDNEVYFGADPSSPAIGDVRITVTYTPPGVDFSLIAQVQGNTFIPFTSENGIEFWSSDNGIVSAEQMFEDELGSDAMMTWIIRVVGILFIIGGLRAIFVIIPKLSNSIPLFGSIANAGLGFACIVLGVVWSSLIIAIVWLLYRPLIAVIFIVIAGAGIFFLIKRAKARRLSADESVLST